MAKNIKLSPWIKDVLSGFVATTLGIVLTFGTTAYIEHKQQKQTANTITKRTLRYIYTSSNSLQKEAASMEKSDSIFKYFNKLYPDSIEYADPAKAELFCQYLGDFSFGFQNTTVEDIFSSSYSIWESIGDDDFIDFVGSSFGIINKVNNDIAADKNMRFQLYIDVVSSDEINNFKSAKEFVAYMMKKHEMREYIIRHTFNTMIVKNTVSGLKSMQQDYMQKTGLTVNDLFEYPDSVKNFAKDTTSF